MTEPLIFEMSVPGRRACRYPADDTGMPLAESLLPQEYLRRQAPDLPEVSELDLVRHFTHLSSMNFGVDTGFYPLGSCTMKYNPKVNERVARLPGFAQLHPYQPVELCQGALRLMAEMEAFLAEITGMDRFSLQPAAGAHGELAGLFIIRAYHRYRGDMGRNKVIVPDSAHGTNPATAALCGMQVVEVKSDARGGVDLAALRGALGPDVAALMLTNPNTLGLFDENIVEIARLVHEAGGLLYYDGANMNAIMGYSRPGDMGFDVIHVNLHKTFATPHGGGGPGAGPVGVKANLAPFLPRPTVERGEQGYYLDHDRPLSIGRVRSFYGNFAVVVKAYAYILSQGGQGLKDVSTYAVLNANYLLSLLRDHFHLPYDRHCKHEFVITPGKLKDLDIRTIHIAKRLLDYGFHPPTTYFPLIVEEAMMVEPTETESRETLESFAKAMIAIAREAVENPELVKSAPHHTPVTRLDEATAARKPVVRWKRE